MTFDDLRTLDAGKGEKIPTLDEVLVAVGKDTLVNVELKGKHTAQPVAALITDYIQNKGWLAENFLVSSFDHVELHDFKQLAPSINIGALICGIPLDLAQCATTLQAYSLNLSDEFISQDLVDDAHKRGLKVFVYTVNTVEGARLLKNMGVDGIFTDYPDRIKG
ncbi:MAG: glycerophosphodiester phosphodiesterase [Patescibacteria group bacterium]